VFACAEVFPALVFFPAHSAPESRIDLNFLGGIMPVATGRLNAIVPKKNVSSVLLAFALATAPHAETAGALTWEDLGKKWEPDYTWGTGFSISRTRMAVDERGNLFVSQGDFLYIGSADGKEWKTAPVVSEITNWKHTPVVIGSAGTMVWGDWASRSWGATWIPFPTEAGFEEYSAAAIGPDGSVLYGASMDIIYRADNLNAKPVRMHIGETYGSIIDIEISASGKAYAAPEADDLLVSRDGGKTWDERRSLIKKDPSAPAADSLESGLLALETAYPEASLWMARKGWGIKTQVVEYAWSGDSLQARRPANAGAPDSALTGLQVQRLASGGTALWLGTWGQGVYHSLDRGATWHAMNAGLRSLYVEGLVLGANGRLFALTTTGLLSLATTSAGISARPGSGNAPDRRVSGFAPLPGGIGFADADGRGFRADGRLLFPAARSGGKTPAFSTPAAAAGSR
jgi:hypothetical protein